MTDAIAGLAWEICQEGRFLDTISFLRRNGLSFLLAKKYATEMKEKAAWRERAHKRWTRDRKAYRPASKRNASVTTP